MSDSSLHLRSIRSGQQLLAVEPRPDGRELLREALGELYELVFAASAEQALSLLCSRGQSLSLVLLSLEGGGSLELLRRVKEDSLLSGLPVLVVSEDRGEEADALDLGAHDFVLRPCPPRVLRSRVRRALELAAVGALPGTAEQSARALTYDALHDPVTGLYNRSAFDVLLRDADQEHIALLIASVDDYAQLAPRFGREAAEGTAARVARELRRSFRSVDFLCRLEEDSFAAIITRINSSMRPLIADKVAGINAALGEAEEGLPAVSLSVGVAFADREDPDGDLCHDARAALERLRETKRRGVAFA